MFVKCYPYIPKCCLINIILNLHGNDFLLRAPRDRQMPDCSKPPIGIFQSLSIWKITGNSRFSVGTGYYKIDDLYPTYGSPPQNELR